ncbi:complex I 51 kDa subunit family protein [Desulfoferrobacter suflitae]|uniref:complex I 51 kDa subunit family protein n=1 Tax=Desulfoferrobacter suflitae TaxID=2865782 RepID=UPI00216447C0|nr:NADH-ubiquinone oxidoreductase-F iron-sulfur binding region domain-containing protein [Desulfoferrobacter suflitae]MCK8600332.1 SLBB domain-containing protein [Desulfoferrobacter suflitae]
MSVQVLFQNRRPDRIATLDEYRRSGGYTALSGILRDKSRRDVIQRVTEANLLGRGGAGFPAGKKWSLVAEDAPFPRYIVVNSDEMEPGTFKDRVLIHTDPHTIIEGIIITGYAVSAQKAFVFVRPSYETSAVILEQEVEAARQAGYLGKHILGSDFSFEIVVHRSGGRYICGEGTAILNAIMGKRPNPMKPPPYPTVKGLWGQPTVVNNIETLAFVPHIIRNGADWFKNLAATENGAGTKLYCISGKVRQPGCIELPIGTRLSEIIQDHCGGMLDGSQFKACLPGGASTRYLTPEHYDVPMDFDSLKAIGHRLGTAAIMVFDHKTCLVGVTLNLIQFFSRESCGWCTPCREGLPYIQDLLWRIENGEGREEYIPRLETMAKHMWNAYCALAPGAASPVESLLTFFEDEVREHISQRKCPFR